MGACEINSKINFEDYSKVGVTTRDVHEHYLETGRIGSPEAIKYKIEQLKKGNVPKEVLEGAVENNDYDFTQKATNDWLTKLTSSLDVPSEIVTREDAARLHEQKGKTYNGEKSFFNGGKVYFVEGTLNPESVVHEFSHPFVKMILKQNPELFNALYNQLIQTEEGAQVDAVVKLNYRDKTDEQIKEEVLVRALTASTLSIAPKDEFTNFISELLFHIKQALRNLVGKKIDISKLNANTTMLELAEILSKGDKIAMDKALYTNEDVFDYLRDYSDFVDSFTEILENDEYDSLQKIINDTYDIAVAQLNTINSVPELNSLAELIAEEYGNASVLNKIKEELGPLHTNNDLVIAIGEKDKNGLVNTQKVIEQKLMTLTNNLFAVEKVLDSIMDSLEETSKLSSKEQMTAYHYYSTYLKNWSTVVEDLENASFYQYERTELHDFSDKLSRKLKVVNKRMQTVKTNAVVDVMYDSLKESGDNAMEEFKNQIGRLSNATQGLRDQKYLEFHNMTEEQYKLYSRLKANGHTKNRDYVALHSKWLDGSSELTKDKLKSILMGETKDANWFNSMIESASLNTDPTIFSIHDHIQQQIAKFEILAKSRFEEYVDAIKPHIKKNGGKFQNRGALGRKMGFKDNVAKVQDGKLVEYQEWVFLNKWKDYRRDDTTYKHAIQVAHDNYAETNNDVDKKALEDARNDYAKWKNQFMHQEFSAEFYETADILNKDDIGQEAKERRNEIFSEMSFVQQDESLTNDEKMHKIDSLWGKHKELQAIYLPNGSKKTGLDLQVAERLKEYSEARGKFYTFQEKDGEFQEAYNEYVNEVINAGFLPGTKDHTDMVNLWLKKNTMVAVKNSVMDSKQKLLSRRKELISKLVEINKSIGDDSAERQLISDMVKFVTDDFQPEGSNASSDIRKKVRDAHISIEKILENLYSTKTGGLTKAETKRLGVLIQLEKDKNITSAETTEKLALLDKQLNLDQAGLDDSILSELKLIDKELSQYSTTEPTTSFTQNFIDIMENDSDLFELFKNFLSETVDIDEPSDAIGQDFIDFVRSKHLKVAKSMNNDFKQFVEENFYMREKYVSDDSKYISELAPTDLWTYRASADAFDYKTKMLKDLDGKNIGLIQIDGIYRTPSLAYQQRMMKDEYVTEKIVGETVDNKGNFLPKEDGGERYVNTEYEALKNDDRDSFDFMEELKNQHLKSQELAEDRDKLYLSFPQTRKTRLENWNTGNVLKFKRRLYDFWKGSGDDLESLGNAAEMTSKDFIQENKFGVFEHAGANIPVKGVARLNYIEDQSTDILKTMPEYMASIYHKRGAAESSTYARSVLDVTAKNDDVDKTTAFAINQAARRFNLTSVWKGRSTKNRTNAMNALIERDLDGVFIKKNRASGPRLEKTISAMNASVGFRLFSANPISGLKNYMGIKLLAITHAFAGDKMNPYNGMVGEAWAVAASTEISKNIRSRGKKGYREQMVQLFDPAGGRANETMGDNLSRTFVGDMLELKFLQNGRKWMELQGAIQTFAGLMHNKKIRISVNGTHKYVRYLNAFELVDGRLQSKEGVDSKYALTYDSEGKPVMGEGLIKQRLEMQQVIMTWNGTFAKKDAALVERNIFAKQLFFLRRHLVPMTAKNYAFSIGTGSNFVKKRMNWTTGKTEYGHFTSTAKSLYTLVRHWKNGVKYMSKEELKSMVYVVNYIVIGSFLLPQLQGLLSVMKPGPDGDDSDEIDYNGMRKRSGYLGDDVGPLTDDPKYDFKMKGFILNQLALLNAQAKGEYNALNVTSLEGLKEYLQVAKSPNPVGISVMLNSVMEAISFTIGDEKDTYTTDNNVYIWEQGDYKHGKLYNTMFELVGINGKNFNPVKALEDYESFKKGKN